tara:strand:- start:3675 stop:3929 length:255 start_codon:yes stop_codon:yes gene_type:complete
MSEDHTDLLREVHNEVYRIAQERIGPDDPTKVLAVSGVLMKIAIELYTVVLDDDSIVGLLERISEDVPRIRETMEKSLGERVLH